MPNPAAGADRRAALAAAGLITASFLALWLSLPDKTFVFDGTMFAGIIDRTSSDWRAELVNPRHFLFNPALQLLRDGLNALGVSVGAYRLIQIVNAIAGAAGLWLFGSLLLRLVEDDALAVFGAALLGSTWTYGTRATEGQVYMLLAFGGLGILWAAARLLSAPGTGRALSLACVFGVTVLFHASAAFMLPCVAAALWFALSGGRSRALAPLAAAAAIVLLPYCMHFRGMGLQVFMGRATDYRLAGAGGYWSGLLLKFWNMGASRPWQSLLHSWNETGQAAAVLPAAAATVLGASLWVTVAAGVYWAWPALDEGRRRLVAVLSLAWGGFVGMNMFWGGSVFFTVLPSACLLALMAAAASPRLKSASRPARLRLAGAVGALALASAAWNASRGLRPQSLIENNPAYSQAMYVRAHTVPSSYVIITGLGNSNLKVYIPNFAGRARDVLEYYFLSHPKDEALRLLSLFIAQASRCGIPLYLHAEVVDDVRIQGNMRREWGVAPEDIRAAFGPGMLLTMARRPDIGLYMFVPAERRPELFSGLGYSVLTEDDMTRLGESVFAMKEIAGAMSPAERRRAGEMLKSSGWGFDLLRAGFSPRMNSENRHEAELRHARFADRQKTADFWLRAGNLYKFLGLKEETMLAWSRAQKLSGDVALIKDIEALKKAK